MRKFIVWIMIFSFWCLSACSNNSAGNPVETSTNKSAHTNPAGPGITEALKGKTLDNYPSATIGAAFDGYTHFLKREWKETHAQNGKIYVDVIGWLAPDSLTAESVKSGVSAQAVDVKFVINADGSLFVGMISKLESRKDGKVYSFPLVDTAPILEQIYANKRMTL